MQIKMTTLNTSPNNKKIIKTSIFQIITTTKFKIWTKKALSTVKQNKYTRPILNGLFLTTHILNFYYLVN